MLAGSLAHSGLLGLGREEDWASHFIVHEIGALYDETHGITLYIVFPVWMKYVYKTNLDRFVQFAKRVFQVSTDGKTREDIALEGIYRFEGFLKELGLPTSFKEAGLPTDKIHLMAEKVTENGPLGRFKKTGKRGCN